MGQGEVKNLFNQKYLIQITLFMSMGGKALSSKSFVAVAGTTTGADTARVTGAARGVCGGRAIALGWSKQRMSFL